jgi:hypothetical protein
VKYAALVLLLAACDESPFGTRHAPPGEAILGQLQTDVQCTAIATGIPMVGLGNGTSDFYIANSNQQNPQLYAFTPSSGTLNQHGTPVSNSEKISDVAVRGSDCPYVSGVSNGTRPLPLATSHCSGSDPTYAVSPVVFAFDSSGVFYFARPDNGFFGRIHEDQTMDLGNDLTIHAVRLTINNTRTEIWIAYQPSANNWDILAFDTTSLKQKGHIQFPWPNADLAGMEWDDSPQTLTAIANMRTPVICTFSFSPASL